MTYDGEPMLICHLLSVFGEVSIKVFASLLMSLFIFLLLREPFLRTAEVLAGVGSEIVTLKMCALKEHQCYGCVSSANTI